jgi:Holliday junction resolvasome RuvABC endonuclease subunit
MQTRLQMIISFGIDPSLSSCGLVICKDEKVVSHLLIKTTAKKSTEARIFEIEKNICYGIKKFKPSIIIMESYSFGSRGRSASLLHELGGVIKKTLYLSGIPWYVVAPTSIKAFAGHGRASKQDMIEWAQVKWPKCPNQNDIADAFWASQYGFKNYQKLIDTKGINCQ